MVLPVYPPEEEGQINRNTTTEGVIKCLFPFDWSFFARTQTKLPNKVMHVRQPAHGENLVWLSHTPIARGRGLATNYTAFVLLECKLVAYYVRGQRSWYVVFLMFCRNKWLAYVYGTCGYLIFCRALVLGYGELSTVLT